MDIRNEQGQPTNETDLNVSVAFIAQARELLASEYLAKIERCLESLSDEAVWWRANDESNSIGNLLLHLSGNARQWIISGLGGAEDQRARQTEFDERSIIPKRELLSRLRDTLAEVDAVLARFDAARLLNRYHIQRSDVTALEAIFHVVEHFSMHAGQIVLLTKQLTAQDMHFYDFDGDTPVLQIAPHPSRAS